jgi:hypothetical protein
MKSLRVEGPPSLASNHNTTLLLPGRFIMRQMLIALTLLLCLGLLGCVNEKKNAIEGTWRLVSGWQKTAEATDKYSQANYQGIKMIYGGHWAILGRSVRDKDTLDNYGGGTYTLEGNNYTESIQYFVAKAAIGNVVPFEVEVRNDTLIQKGPRKIGEYADSKWELYEVWTRMK